MATIIHLTDFSDDAYFQFIEDINNTEEVEDREIYLSSQGGPTWAILPFKRIIEDRQIPIIAHTDVFSSALILLLTVATDVTILDYTRGLYHYPYLKGVRLYPNGKVNYSSSTSEKLSQSLFVDIDKIDSLLGITKAQKKELKEGADFLYTAEELRKFIEKSKKQRK